MRILISLVLFCLLQCRASCQLQDISPKHLYTVEICYDPSRRFILFDTTKALVVFYAKIIYKEETVYNQQFADLVKSLKKYSPREGKPVEIRWSIVIRDEQNKEVCTCCLDGWGMEGYVDGVSVIFANDTANWFRKYLTEAFDLKNEPIVIAPQR